MNTPELRKAANQVRKNIVTAVYYAKAGHPGGSLSAAGRAFEQIRNSIGYTGMNVKIGATHGGISVGEDGASHQCLEDLALMRTIPGMVVMCPAGELLHKYELDGEGLYRQIKEFYSLNR